MLALTYRRQRLLASGFELIAGNPARHFICVCDVHSDRETQLGIFDHAVEVPVIAELVGRLVIALRLVSLELFLAPTGRLTDEICASVQVHSGHADLRKTELIRTIEV